MTEEAKFYNACAITLEANYSQLVKLKENYSTWSEAWENLRKTNPALSPESENKKIAQLGLEVIFKENPEFPELLREIPNPPIAIYALGNTEKLKSPAPSLAIVGTRKATESGLRTAREFAKTLAQANLAIVSGLALGIDASAHEGSLEGNGYTVAVLGTGLDRIYPKTNERLAKKILSSNGALVSEYPPGTPSLPYHFIQRNRIISGLTRGTLVVEAPEKSGATATARFALDQNREVFIIPGPINHPNFKKSHELIRDGATLVTEPKHILEVVAPDQIQINQSFLKYAIKKPEEKMILELLKKSDLSIRVDKIIELTKLDAHVVNQALSILSINGQIKETEGGYVLWQTQ